MVLVLSGGHGGHVEGGKCGLTGQVEVRGGWSLFFGGRFRLEPAQGFVHHFVNAGDYVAQVLYNSKVEFIRRC